MKKKKIYYENPEQIAANLRQLSTSQPKQNLKNVLCLKKIF